MTTEVLNCYIPDSMPELLQSRVSFDRTYGPFDPRPGKAPLYISASCAKCGAALVLDDELDGLPPELTWNDEWVCPRCPERTVLIDAPGSLGRVNYA